MSVSADPASTTPGEINEGVALHRHPRTPLGHPWRDLIIQGFMVLLVLSIVVLATIDWNPKSHDQGQGDPEAQVTAPPVPEKIGVFVLVRVLLAGCALGTVLVLCNRTRRGLTRSSPPKWSNYVAFAAVMLLIAIGLLLDVPAFSDPHDWSSRPDLQSLVMYTLFALSIPMIVVHMHDRRVRRSSDTPRRRRNPIPSSAPPIRHDAS